MATYTLIASNTVGSGGTASIEFNSIPQTYTDLLIKISARNTNGSSDAHRCLLRFNGSTDNTGLTFLRLGGDGSTIFTDTGSQGHVAWINADGSTSSTYSNIEVYIPNYAGSNEKHYSAFGGNEKAVTSTAYLAFFANKLASTSAITSITILNDSGSTLKEYSTAYLYGISNA